MTPAGAARLLTLAAIWGGSYLFMRIAAPEIGAYWVAETRLVLAALFLSLTALWLKNALHAARYWRHYVILGLFNSALPFLLFAYAAETLSASLLSIINATAPLWGALIGAALGRQELDWRRGTGLALGFAGVGVLVGLDSAVASGDHEGDDGRAELAHHLRDHVRRIGADGFLVDRRNRGRDIQVALAAAGGCDVYLLLDAFPVQRLADGLIGRRRSC